jgi:hypothetical protein
MLTERVKKVSQTVRAYQSGGEMGHMDLTSGLATDENLHFRSGTYEISSGLIFVEQGVQVRRQKKKKMKIIR